MSLKKGLPVCVRFWLQCNLRSPRHAIHGRTGPTASLKDTMTDKTLPDRSHPFLPEKRCCHPLFRLPLVSPFLLLLSGVMACSDSSMATTAYSGWEGVRLNGRCTLLCFIYPIPLYRDFLPHMQKV
jgi:hypothetical protein